MISLLIIGIRLINKLSVVCILLFVIVLCIPTEFSTEKWISNSDDRYMIVGILQKEYFLEGKTEQEITELLGEPDSIQNHSSDEGEFTHYKYYIGPSFKFDPDMLLIVFCNGYVIGSDVQPT